MAKQKVTPITPDEVGAFKERTFPPEAIEAFNELIAENFSNGSATVKQDDVVARMEEKGLERSAIFDKGWLNVEGMFEEAGWQVKYDKPGYNESYAANFRFSLKSRA